MFDLVGDTDYLRGLNAEEISTRIKSTLLWKGWKRLSYAEKRLPNLTFSARPGLIDRLRIVARQASD